MAKYIEKDAVVQKIVEIANQYNGSGNPDFGMLRAANIIDNTSDADVVPVVYGEWEGIIQSGIDAMAHCSVCGGMAVWRLRKSPYILCPNCGAKMKVPSSKWKELYQASLSCLELAESKSKDAELEKEDAIAEIERLMVRSVIAGNEPCDMCANASKTPCEVCEPKWKGRKNKK